jgi:hypothetical protein
MPKATAWVALVISAPNEGGRDDKRPVCVPRIPNLGLYFKFFRLVEMATTQEAY